MRLFQTGKFPFINFNLASADNFLRVLHDSSYHTKTAVSNSFYYLFNIPPTSKHAYPFVNFPLQNICLFLGSFRLWKDVYSSRYHSYSSCHPSRSYVLVYSCYNFKAVARLFRLRITCEIFRQFLQLRTSKTDEPPCRDICTSFLQRLTLRLRSIVN